MPYLIVDHRQVEAARELVGELGIPPHLIITCGLGKRHDQDRANSLSPGAQVVLVSVRAKLFKHCEVLAVCETVRGGRSIICEHLAPGPPPAPDAAPRPRAAFVEAAERQRRLVLAPRALAHADELPSDRDTFCASAARALEAWASDGKVLQGIDKYFRDLGLVLARSGSTEYVVTVRVNGQKEYRGTTQWHLSKSKCTSREHAARIYFLQATIRGCPLVVVLHVGPHPPEKTSIEATVDVPLQTLNEP